MIEFKVTGGTWKEILEKLEGMWPEIEKVPTGEPISDIIETTEKPTDEFKPKENTDVEALIGPEIEVPKKWNTGKLPIGERPTYKIPRIETEVVSPPAYTVPGVKLDDIGKPWDPEIHTRTKAKNDDGSWRLKRKTPGFPKKSGPVKPEPGKVTTPQALPDFTTAPSLQINDLTKFAAYAMKINTEKNLTENVIREYMLSIGIPNILQVPKEKYSEVAESLKAKFGVEF